MTFAIDGPLGAADRSCGHAVRGNPEPFDVCALEAGHKGYHAGVTFTCDGCSRTFRGQPYRSGRGPGWSDEEFGFCFLCVKEGERQPFDV